MVKYNEIMGRIKVTDEMRGRILDNVNRHFAGRSVRRRRSLYLTFGGIDAAEIIYASIDKNLAEIDYSGSDTRLIFRKSAGDEDNSGDYNIYKEVKEIEVNNIKVTLKGDEGLVSLAVWTDKGYSCSISVDKGIKKDEMVKIKEE